VFKKLDSNCSHLWDVKEKCSVFHSGQPLENVGDSRAIGDKIIPTDSSVAEHQHAFGRPCDAVFMSNKDNRQALIIQGLEDLHNLNRSTAIKIHGRFVREKNAQVHGAVQKNI